MKIKEYLQKLSELAEKYPNAKVIYSSDDEGNSFDEVIFPPSAGNYSDYEYTPDDGTEEFKVNCICLN